MNISRILFLGGFILALAAPHPGGAQTPAPSPQSTGDAERSQFGMRMFQGITLTDAQQQQIDQIVAQFRQSHQPGAPRDPQAMQNLRAAIENVLTPDQRTQFESNLAQMRAHFQNWHHGNGNGNPPAPQTSPTPAP